ncbi:MAG TPA: hypothetical protein VEQ10_06545 [Vicinamibacteria bacterium]|nr:hypothetical protein [Vicinamibacteria bacterium]
MSVLPIPVPSDAVTDVDGPAATDPRLRTRHALEDLLRARRLRHDAPPLRGEDRRLRALASGLPAVDALLGGGFPRGQLSEVHGPASSGRTSVLLSLVARLTAGGGLVALIDPLDRLDPSSAAAAGTCLERLLWLRGPRAAHEDTPLKALAAATSATATLAGSGLFELVALDLAGESGAAQALPAATWLRLQRLVEETPTALLLVADRHLACGPGGITLALEPAGACWSGPPGPACLLRGLLARASTGRHALRSAELTLAAPA